MPGWAESLGGDLASILGPLTGRALAALLVVLIAWRLATTTRAWAHRLSGRTSADVNHRLLLSRFLYFVVLVFGLVWALEVLGVNPAALLTAVGVLGLAASLALQDLLKNFVSGVYLLFERPFRIGEEIKVRDFQGHVVDVGMRTTSLRTADDQLVLIPNAIVMAEVVTNRSAATGAGAAATAHTEPRATANTANPPAAAPPAPEPPSAPASPGR
jgi:small-conductance mechanosensitive channel